MFDSIVAFDNLSRCLLIQKLRTQFYVVVVFVVVFFFFLFYFNIVDYRIEWRVRAWITFDKHIHFIL